MFNLKIVALAAIAVLFMAIPSEAATTKNRTHYTHTTTCKNIDCLLKQRHTYRKPTHKTYTKKTYKKTYAHKKVSTKKHYVNTKEPVIEKRLISRLNRGVYTQAALFVGLSERGNTRTIQKLTGVNPRSTPWCAAFVNGVLRSSGHKTSGSNLAASFRRYGKAVRKPSRGDIVVFRGHVGLFAGYVTRNGQRYVAVLGGNQSNRVQISYYPARRVVAYRRPA